MRPVFSLFLLGFMAHTASAQPADCVADPPPTASMPLSLNLQGLHGVPAGLQGFLEADVPVAPPGGTRCSARPPPSSWDVLAGPPGDVLHGEGPRDFLRGPVPRVEIEKR